jgi:hypothetical protein
MVGAGVDGWGPRRDENKGGPEQALRKWRWRSLVALRRAGRYGAGRGAGGESEDVPSEGSDMVVSGGWGRGMLW